MWRDVFPNFEQEQRVKIREPIERRAEALLEIAPVFLRVVESMCLHVRRIGDDAIEKAGVGLEVICQNQLRAARGGCLRTLQGFRVTLRADQLDALVELAARRQQSS